MKWNHGIPLCSIAPLGRLGSSTADAPRPIALRHATCGKSTAPTE
jgi:hypothetical protein